MSDDERQLVSALESVMDNNGKYADVLNTMRNDTMYSRVSSDLADHGDFEDITGHGWEIVYLSNSISEYNIDRNFIGELLDYQYDSILSDSLVNNMGAHDTKITQLVIDCMYDAQDLGVEIIVKYCTLLNAINSINIDGEDLVADIVDMLSIHHPSICMSDEFLNRESDYTNYFESTYDNVYSHDIYEFIMLIELYVESNKTNMERMVLNFKRRAML